MSIVEQLVAMGFPSEAAQLAAANNRTMDQALNFIENDGVGFEPTTVADVEETKDVPVAAVSYRCDDCGKHLANDDAVMRHANATKHGRFSESARKELSTEEKAAQLMDIVRKVKEEADAKQEEARTPAQAMASHREEARDREVREAARQIALKKVEDEVARKRVLEQIRLDREERKARVTVAPVTVAPPTPKDHSKTMIQFRLLDGSVIKQEFKVDEKLEMVKVWIEGNHSMEKFLMMTPFPRKVFGEEDMGMMLKELNLVPTANIVLQKIQKPATPPPTNETP